MKTDRIIPVCFFAFFCLYRGLFRGETGKNVTFVYKLHDFLHEKLILVL